MSSVSSPPLEAVVATGAAPTTIFITLVGYVNTCRSQLAHKVVPGAATLTPSGPDGMMPPREGPPMERRGSRLSRRAFVAGAGVAGLRLVAGCGRWPWQQAPSVPRIGFLAPGSQEGRAPLIAGLLEGLHELG